MNVSLQECIAKGGYYVDHDSESYSCVINDSVQWQDFNLRTQVTLLSRFFMSGVKIIFRILKIIKPFFLLGVNDAEDNGP